MLTAVTGRSTAEVVDALSDLVDHRLVAAYDGPGEPAFTVVPLLRDFAADRLVDDGERDLTEAAHTRAMTTFVLAHGEAVESALDDASLSELTRSEPDIRRAMRRLMGEADVSEGLRLVTALAPYVLRRSYDGFVGPALNTLLQRAGSPVVGDDVRARALLWRARLAVHFDGPETVTDLRGDLEVAVALARRSGDPQTLLVGLAHVMLALPVTGDFAGAGSAAAEGLPLAEAAGDDRWAARFCAWAGMVANQAGDVDRAEQLARRGVQHVRAVPDHRAEVLLAMLAAGLPDGRGATLTAQLPDVEDLIASARRLDDSRYVPFLLRNAAVAAIRAEDLPAAAARCAEGLRLAAQQGAWHGLPFTVMVLGLVAAGRDDLAEAARCHGMVRDRLDQLRPAAPGQWFDGYVATMDDVRRQLGEAAFEAAAGEGADALTGNPLPALLDYADRVAGAARPGRRTGPVRDRGDTVLTPREEDVLRALATGVTNNEISRLLGMSPKTVMHHSVSIYRKLGVRGRAEATAWALRQGVAR
jgi:DNA-binding CsgD family transcriptional regulator